MMAHNSGGDTALEPARLTQDSHKSISEVHNTAGRRYTIYVAGPIRTQNGRTELQHAADALTASLRLIALGHYPFCPHLSVYPQERFGVQMLEYEQWMAYDQAFLEMCDALYYMAPSAGADRELAYAKSLGKRIFYNIDEVPDVGGLPAPQM